MTKDSKEQLPKSSRARRFLSPRVKKKQAHSVNSEALPRITNDTVSKHREEVLSGAKKYIYPLRHSRHRVVIITVSLLVVLFIGFATYTLVNLYKLNNTSAFMYQITKVVPLPVGRIGKTLVGYDDYLFEMQHYIHYVTTQQNIDFNDPRAQEQLALQRKNTVERVMNNAYAKKIAREKGITVSEKEVSDDIALMQAQNRLGGDAGLLQDVLKKYYDWTVQDFENTRRQVLLNNKVVQSLDTTVNPHAQDVLAQLKAGANFADVAKAHSDDLTSKENGGQYGYLFDKNDRNIPPQTIDALSRLQPGQFSEIIQLNNGLEIVKLDAVEGDKFKASRIFFSYKELKEYLNDIKEQQPAQVYIKP